MRLPVSLSYTDTSFPAPFADLGTRLPIQFSDTMRPMRLSVLAVKTKRSRAQDDSGKHEESNEQQSG